MSVEAILDVGRSGSANSSSKRASPVQYIESDFNSYRDLLPISKDSSPARLRERTGKQPRPLSISTSSLAKSERPLSGNLHRSPLSPIYKTIYPTSQKDAVSPLSPIYKTIYPRIEKDTRAPKSPLYKTIAPRHVRRHSIALQSPIRDVVYPRAEKEGSIPPLSPIYKTIQPRDEKHHDVKRGFEENPNVSRIVMFRDGREKITCTQGHTTILFGAEDLYAQHRKWKCVECEPRKTARAPRADMQEPKRANSKDRYAGLGLKRSSTGAIQCVRGLRVINAPRTANFLEAITLKPSSTHNKGRGYTLPDKPSRARSEFSAGIDSLIIASTPSKRDTSKSRNAKLPRFRTYTLM
ncbi:hypothetical protein FQN55_001776 [Onygenales sp. PD_40]|nr:hypothetical protein FQN55_001776 [Onygenales sp. PD_40]KAK2787745.1 hypothetical protein FQN51_003084 [Onygenales sp. PD_10]